MNINARYNVQALIRLVKMCVYETQTLIKTSCIRSSKTLLYGSSEKQVFFSQKKKQECFSCESDKSDGWDKLLELMKLKKKVA